MRRGGRTAGWFLAVTLMLVAVWGLYRVFDRLAQFGPEQGVEQVLLPVLSLGLVVLVLALAGVLIRNLVVLIVERKRGILGARLRTKLVFFFLALVLAPAFVLFSGSAQVIKQTVDAVLRTPLEELTRRSGDLAAGWKAYLRGEALSQASAIAARLASDRVSGPEALAEDVARWRTRPDLQQVRITDGEQRIVDLPAGNAGLDAERQEELDGLLAELSRTVARERQEATRIEHLGPVLVAHAAVPVVRAGSDEPLVVSVAIALPPHLAGSLEGVDEAERMYRQFRVQRRQLIRLYLTLIGVVFLVTLFVATWIGFYLARRITGPIQQLAAATREIAAGNLGVRVRDDVGDELGMLVGAFNEMAGELQENREVITRSTADLRDSYRALDERRRYIETLLANLSTAVLSLDAAGRVSTVNPAVRRILGVELAVGEDARTVVRARGLSPLADLLDALVDGKVESLRRDMSLERDGALAHLVVQASTLRGAAGESLAILVMAEDLTELLRAQKAAAWREVARRIAHEIKNPLTPIQLAAQRLRKKFGEGSADLAQVVPEATASIEREVSALKQLVDEFSLFARLPEVVPRDADLAGVVDSALALFREQGELRWEVDLDPDVGRVRLDPEQMRRVLINLFDNAVGATQGRGTIRVRVRRDVAQRLVRLEVADDGPGIDPADADRLFAPYFSTKKRGTGLGLAIVHKVISDHQGTIRVERNEPRGARFVIELPA